MLKMLSVVKNIFLGALLGVLFYNCSDNSSSDNTVTVTFDTFGGTEIDPQNIVSGETAKKPDNPTRSDYTFTGSWYKSSSDNLPVFSNNSIPEAYDFNITVSSDIKLYAGFLISKLPVSIDNNEGEGTLPPFEDTEVPLTKLSENQYSYTIYNEDLSGLNDFGTSLARHMGALASSSKNGLLFQGLSFNKSASSDADIFIKLGDNNQPILLPAVATKEGLENAIKSALLQISIKGNISITLADQSPKAVFYASYY